MEHHRHDAAIDAIAKAVNAEIARRGTTIAHTASLAGIDRSVLCRWLNGKRNTSAATASLVLEALDLKIARKATTPARRS